MSLAFLDLSVLGLRVPFLKAFDPMFRSPTRRCRSILCLGISILLLICGRTPAVEKPRGWFSASGAAGTAIYDNTQLRGVLIRASWKDLEVTPGVFNFTALNAAVNKARSEGVGWSLAKIGRASCRERV